MLTKYSGEVNRFVQDVVILQQSFEIYQIRPILEKLRKNSRPQMKNTPSQESAGNASFRKKRRSRRPRAADKSAFEMFLFELRSRTKCGGNVLAGTNGRDGDAGILHTGLCSVKALCSVGILLFFPLVKTATEQDMIITAMHTLASITARVIEIELHHEALKNRRIATKRAATSIAMEGKKILSFPLLLFLYISHNADSYPTETIKMKISLT